MLSFVMVTRNEGRPLDVALHALRRAMGPEDRLIAIDTGSTDQTIARLKAFRYHAPCDLIQLETQALHPGEALSLALDTGQTPYVVPLSPQDRLRPNAMAQVRAALHAEGPPVAVLNSGWWFADPAQLLPRADAQAILALPGRPAPEALLDLCPDPRRLVLACHARAAFAPVLQQPLSPTARYCALIRTAPALQLLATPALLHPQETRDPTPQLETLRAQLADMDAPARARVLLWSDDAVLTTAPDQAQALCDQLRLVLRALPRRDRAALGTHPGPSGALFAALHRGRVRDAVMQFTLGALARQHQSLAQLARDHTDLLLSVEAALPGSDYLQQLYNQARNI